MRVQMNLAKRKCEPFSKYRGSLLARKKPTFEGAKHVSKEILLSQKDIGNSEMLKLYPIYMLPFLIEDL